ncbi:hypothetical protein [Niabella beijingensis]|nr:hypothetical protein [Niabella beijingensis]
MSTPGQRVLKISAAFAGGYLVTFTFHLCLLYFLNKKGVLVTAFFSTYLLWSGLMIWAFLSKNGWKIWGWFILLSIVFVLPYLYEFIVKD